MKTIIALTIVGLASIAYLSMPATVSVMDSEFQSFIQAYGPNYASAEEYEFRLQTFKANMEEASKLNESNPRATFGVTKFSDRTSEEFSQMLTKRSSTTNGNGCDNIRPSNAPVSVDWRSLMGEVKDQGSCGSCWTFAVAAVTEGRYALSQGQSSVSTRFSEQSLVDCDTRINNGCYGGNEYLAFQFWEHNDVVLEKDYPYTAKHGGACKKAPATDIRIKSCTNLNADKGEIVAELKTGPIDIGVDASSWQHYKKGVMSDCSGRGNNHAVTIVAYDTADESVTVRNSWSGDWGEAGHIRLDYNNNACGWNNDVHSIYF